MPLSVLEYMAAGKPTVATAVGGVPELIRDGIDGILVPRRDLDGLAAALVELLTDRERATSMGVRAAMRQRLEFSRAAMVARFEALYLELFERTLERSKRRPWSGLRETRSPDRVSL